MEPSTQKYTLYRNDGSESVERSFVLAPLLPDLRLKTRPGSKSSTTRIDR